MTKPKCWYCGKELKPVKLTIQNKSVNGFGCFSENCLADRSYTTVIDMKELEVLEGDE